MEILIRARSGPGSEFYRLAGYNAFVQIHTQVTGLCWSPRYPDLFAASYGSYNFYSSHTEGWLCLFSLKNPSYPEWAIKVPAGVMCLASHPAHPHMLAAGLHDGTVVVYNLHRYHTTLLY